MLGVSLRQQRKSLFDALLYKKHPDLYRRHIRPAAPLDYYGMLLALLTALGGGLAGSVVVPVGAGCVWAVLMVRFLGRRLRGTSRAPAHLAEMVCTSLLIPALSVFWRLYGAVKFRCRLLSHEGGLTASGKPLTACS
jgi:hypothetical protein